jgi:hypothetical protein
MGTPVIRDRVQSTGGGTSSTVTTPSTTQAGDLFVCFHNNEWGTNAGMTAPTGSLSTGSWTLRASDANPQDRAHGKLWTALSPSNGAKTITVNSHGGAETMLNVFIIDVETLHESWFDGATATQNSASSTSWQFNSVSPSGDDDLLLGAVGTSGGTTTHGTPSGMTKVATQNSRTYSTQSVYSQALTSAGATGTKSSTASPARNYASLVIAIRGSLTAAQPADAFLPFFV